jgi:ABC-type multidrug transport system ATPase subunit
MRNILSIQNLSLHGQDQELILAVREFSIAASEFIHLTGPSGSGKSLFLKCLVYLFPMKYDSYEFFSQPVDSINVVELRRKMLYLNQFPELGDKTVGEVYKTFSSLKCNSHHSWKTSNIKSFLERLNFSWEEWIKRPIPYLSGGELQILQHSLASALDASIYLLDETLSAIDQDKRKIIFNYYLDKTQKENKTVVLIDHHPVDHSQVILRNFLDLTTHTRNLVR